MQAEWQTVDLDYFDPLHEPQHDKTNKVSMRPAKTHISQGIHPV